MLFSVYYYPSTSYSLISHEAEMFSFEICRLILFCSQQAYDKSLVDQGEAALTSLGIDTSSLYPVSQEGCAYQGFKDPFFMPTSSPTSTPTLLIRPTHEPTATPTEPVAASSSSSTNLSPGTIFIQDYWWTLLVLALWIVTGLVHRYFPHKVFVACSSA